jgi:hypothetical protein
VAEFTARWSGDKKGKGVREVLPAALEDKLPLVEGRMRKAAAKVDFKCSQERQIVSHINVSSTIVGR